MGIIDKEHCYVDGWRSSSYVHKKSSTTSSDQQVVRTNGHYYEYNKRSRKRISLGRDACSQSLRDLTHLRTTAVEDKLALTGYSRHTLPVLDDEVDDAMAWQMFLIESGPSAGGRSSQKAKRVVARFEGVLIP